jgi:hypothetical protein
MKTTYRNNNADTLRTLAGELAARGFQVSPVVVPEEVWVDGVPYFQTNATNRDILEAIRATR